MTLECIIIDDEPVARKVLEEYIQDTAFLSLAGKAENPIKAKALLDSRKADLLFLDINMPRMSGIEFLKSTANLPMTIMTTAYAEYALEGFELDVIDYLVKPFAYERFLKACTKAREYHELKQQHRVPLPNNVPQEYFFVKCDGRIEKVTYNELVYVEAMANYVVLHTEGRKLIVYHTIKGIADQLPADLFLKIHKSTIVNTSKVKNIDGNVLDLGTAKVTVSQNQRDDVMAQILKGKLLKR